MNEKPLLTPEGESLDPDCVLSEYPRPQLERQSWRCLNGYWDYAIDKSPAEPESYDGRILVPFSPEAPLSGVGRQLRPGEFLHYRLIFDFDTAGFSGRELLHFGAVDERCSVFLNGEPLGGHRGGYLPFTFDITSVLKSGTNVLSLSVADDSDSSYHANGKQTLKRGGIWYTAQSGIWQTVWLENVPENYLKDLRITPDFDNAKVHFELFAENPEGANIVVREEGRVIAEDWTDENGVLTLKMDVFHSFRPWSPEDPFLYDVEINLQGGDRVKSYFGMRKFSVETASDGKKRLFLNNKEYFHSGVLDQGYWPDGLYTAPDDRAMIDDISAMKRLGFNMLRKHIKIEPLRWYYHCDKLGMLVWQDMVSGGRMKGFLLKSALSTVGVTKLRDNKYRFFGRADEAGREEFYRDMERTVLHLYNVPSIALWVIFNEGWGQFDSEKAAERLAALDATRTVDRASGWHDQGGGELLSLHVYFRPFKMKRDRRAVVLSEFGGYNCHVEGHCFNDADYGYRRFKSTEALTAAFRALYENEIIPAKAQGLCASVYTQLSDVEDEQNGLLTYDRRVCKIPTETAAKLNRALIGG